MFAAHTDQGAAAPDQARLPPDVSLKTLYETIGGSGLAESGRALLVSIAPVKAALGTRWATRRDQVYEIVERYFRKYLSPGDVCQPVAETCFLAATPDKSSVLAQALCYRALKEVLTYFLGEVQAGHLEISQVTHLTPDSLEARPFSVAELEQADFEAVPAVAAAQANAAASSYSHLSSWPLKTADGLDLRVSFALDPVLDLKAWAMAGHRIESRIMNQQSGTELSGAQRRKLLPRDFERIDLAALERGMSRLAGAEVPDRPKLIIQLSFASLSNGRARGALLTKARELQQVLRHAAICELVDVESGVPVGRLAEITGLVGGYFRFILVQVQPRREAIEAAIGAKAAGLTVRAADLGKDPSAIAGGMRDFVAMVRGQKSLLTATSLPTTDLLIDAMAVGFSHASLRAKRPAN